LVKAVANRWDKSDKGHTEKAKERGRKQQLERLGMAVIIIRTLG
jgi:hypothetical protein